MSLHVQGGGRARRRAVRLDTLAASALAISAVLAVTDARAQGTTLPTVPVDPQAQPKQAPAAKQAAPQQTAQPKAKAQPQAKQTAAPAAQAAPAPQATVGVAGAPLPEGTLVMPGRPVEQTTAGAVQGYRALTATSPTKTETPIERVPQSVQVVPKSLIDDQRPLSVEEATRNVSAVQGTNRLQTPAYESTLIRGFRGETWVDGIVVYYGAGDRDSLVNVERIEVLKGPNALVYGGSTGSPDGGAINLVSKLPTPVASGEVGFTVGSHKYFRPYFDINQPLNSAGTALFRLTGEYISSGSFIDTVETDRYALNPTLTLTDKTSTTLTIQGRFNSWRQPEYQGLPAVGTVAGNFRLDRDTFIGDPQVPDSYSRVHGVTVTLDHKLDERWSAQVKTRFSKTEFAERVQTIVGADSFTANTPFADPSFWGLANVQLKQELNEFTVAPHIKGRFDVSPAFRNTLLIGADYSRISDVGFLDATILNDLVDLTSPRYPSYIHPTANDRFIDQHNVYRTAGAFGQLQTSLWERLHLTAGVRLGYLDITSIYTPLEERAEETRVLPRLGAVLDIVKGFSLYASYSEGMKVSPGVFYLDTPKPILVESREAGIKYALAPGLTGTMAVFEATRSNVPVSVGFGSLPIGEERARGVETDLVWQPWRSFQIVGSYAYVDAELTADATNAPAGSGLVGVPLHSGRIWADYKLDDLSLKGWSIGAGVYAAGKQPVDLPNQYFVDAFHTIDAKIGYDNGSFFASLVAKNIADKEYYVPYTYFGGRVAPADGRTFYGTAGWRW